MEMFLNVNLNLNVLKVFKNLHSTIHLYMLYSNAQIQKRFFSIDRFQRMRLLWIAGFQTSHYWSYTTFHISFDSDFIISHPMSKIF